MLLRGILGFERTDDPLAFYLTPRPLTRKWHGIENLRLSGSTRLSIQIKDEGTAAACKVKFCGLDEGIASVNIYWVGIEKDARKLVKEVKLNDQNEMTVSLDKSNGRRYLWQTR